MRVVRGLFALLVLLAGVGGVPTALVLLGGNPLPGRWTFEAVTAALLRPDDGRVLIGLITIAGWIAWIVFVVAVAAELVSLLSRQRIRIRLPGLALPQRAVGVLLLVVVAMIAVPHPGPARGDPVHSGPPATPASASAPAVTPSVRTPEPTGTSTVDPTAETTARPTGTNGTAGGSAAPSRAASAPSAAAPRAAQDSTRHHRQASTGTTTGTGSTDVIHEVTTGDDLWSLAEHYYGHGRDWRRIARANPHLLSGGPDRLQVGWRLDIPGPVVGGSDTGARAAEADAYRVVTGDTLSAIAEQQYGDPAAWPGLWAANRRSVPDPDLIEVGGRLVLPDQVRANGQTFLRSRNEPGQRGRPTTSGESADPPGQSTTHRRTAHVPATERGADSTASATPTAATPPSRRAAPGASPTGSAPTSAATSVPTSERAGSNGPRGSHPAGATSGPGPGESSGSGPSHRASAGAGSSGTSSSSTGSAGASAGPTETEPSGTGSVDRPTPTVASPTGDSGSELAPLVAGVGGLLAAGLLAGLLLRRRIQLHTRPVGRRIAHPAVTAQLVEARLGRQQEAVGLEMLDRALRAVGRSAAERGGGLRTLLGATVTRTRIDLHFAPGTAERAGTEPSADLDPAQTPPSSSPQLSPITAGWPGRDLDGTETAVAPDVFDLVDDDTWRLDPAGAAALRREPGLERAVQPYPALVSLGTDETGAIRLINLETVGVVAVAGGSGPDRGDQPAARRAGPSVDPSVVRPVLAALVTELAFSPWSADLVVTVVGADSGLVRAIDRTSVGQVEDLDQLLERWERRAAAQRDRLGPAAAAIQRLQPDLADPWLPEIAIVDGPITAGQQDRLERLLLREPPVTMAVVFSGQTDRGGNLTLGRDLRDTARYDRLEWTIRPQALEPEAEDAVRDLIATTGGEDTTPAPWWAPPAEVAARRAVARELDHTEDPAASPRPDTPGTPQSGSAAGRPGVAVARRAAGTTHGSADAPGSRAIAAGAELGHPGVGYPDLGGSDLGGSDLDGSDLDGSDLDGSDEIDDHGSTASTLELGTNGGEPSALGPDEAPLLRGLLGVVGSTARPERPARAVESAHSEGDTVPTSPNLSQSPTSSPSSPPSAPTPPPRRAWPSSPLPAPETGRTRPLLDDEPDEADGPDPSVRPNRAREEPITVIEPYPITRPHPSPSDIDAGTASGDARTAWGDAGTASADQTAPAALTGTDVHGHDDVDRSGPDGGPDPRPSGSPEVVADGAGSRPSSVERHPFVRLLGPIDLLGAGGPVPSRATKQCVEYCTWLLEHPGTTAQAMANGLAVAEGTRRSNMSRLRAWLGEDPTGQSYLPDAYSGRIRLSPVVTSDWHRLQLLTSAGVNLTGSSGLAAALRLVRGAPLADAAPGQWHWAEEMRTDMVSVVRDIAVELARRCLVGNDLAQARWAAARGLTAAPYDERLMALRIRTEHRAGNVPEVERLVLEVNAHARWLGLDLDPETVDLLQQVIEGRLRARASTGCRCRSRSRYRPARRPEPP